MATKKVLPKEVGSVVEQEIENVVEKENTIVEDKKVPVIQEPIIYCGPNLNGGTLNQFSIYKGGCPVHLEKELKECGAIKRLFVPVSKLATTIAAVSKTGTPEAIWFEEITKYNGGGEV